MLPVLPVPRFPESGGVRSSLQWYRQPWSFGALRFLGTLNFLPRFGAGGTLLNSAVSDDGSVVTSSRRLKISTSTAVAVNAFQAFDDTASQVQFQVGRSDVECMNFGYFVSLATSLFSSFGGNGNLTCRASDFLWQRSSAGIWVMTLDSSHNLIFWNQSSAGLDRARGSITFAAVDNTDASRKYRVILSAYDTAAREFMRFEGSGAAAKGAWFGGSAVLQQSGDIATALENYNLVTSATLAVSKVVGASVIEFDHFADVGNVSTGEDDLYSDTILAGQLATDGDKLVARYGGTTAAHATATRQIRVYFGGTLIYDSTAQVTASADNWDIHVLVERESSSVVRCTVSFTDALNTAAFPGSKYTRVTGLTLSNTQVLKVTGEAAAAGAATDDIIAKLGYVEFKPAAASAVGATAPAFSGCRVYNSANLTISDNTETDLTFNSERYDTASYHSTSASTERLTAPVAGYYRMGASVGWDTNASGTRILGIRYNGTGNYIVIDHRDASTGTLQTRQSVNCEYHLAAGEYVTVTVYHVGSSASRTVSNEFLSSPEAWMSLISPG